MQINSITIQNFQSYYNTQSLPLSEGLNLIIGLGGKGKSKLFNAFYWTLFGKIYITDLGWRETKNLPYSANNYLQKHEVINKRALYLAKEGELVSASVVIDLVDDKGITYQIERAVSAKRLKEDDWNSKLSWDVSAETLKVSYDSANGTLTKVDIAAESIINYELFPEGIRNYIWFQGESLDSLINLRDKKTLEAAVQHISYYPYYQKLSDIISRSSIKIATIEARKKKEANKHNSALTTLISEIESLNRKIEREEASKKEIEGNIKIIEASLAEDETKYSGFSRFGELVAKYKTLELEINRLNNEMSVYDAKQRELLPNLWILRGVDSLVEEARSIIQGYNEEINSVPERKYLDDPGRDKLEEILRSGQCFVCGAKVCEGNDQYNWIRKRLRDQDEYLREKEEFEANMQFMAQFHVFFGKISEFPEHLRIPLQSIDKQWQESEKAIEKIRVVRNKKNEELHQLQSKLDDIRNKFGVDPVKQNEEAGQVEGTIRATRRNLEIQKNRLSACNSALAGYRGELKEKEKEQEKLGAKDPTIQGVPETEWKNISIFLEDVCKRVQENARKELLSMIEKKANVFYAKFTEHDDGYKGTVKINDDYSIEYDAELNTSHEDRKKMSVINALLSLNQEAIGTYYPFISDAPTSSFDYTTTHKYLLGIKDIFNQSIVLTKDVEVGGAIYQELLSQNRVSHVYLLESKHYCDDNRELEKYEVSTIIKTLK